MKKIEPVSMGWLRWRCVPLSRTMVYFLSLLVMLIQLIHVLGPRLPFLTVLNGYRRVREVNLHLKCASLPGSDKSITEIDERVAALLIACQLPVLRDVVIYMPHWKFSLLYTTTAMAVWSKQNSPQRQPAWP